GKDGICREITTSHVSRPGIEITGYFQLYVKERLQLIGRTEMAYLLHLTKEEQRKRLKKLCTNTTPGIIVTWDMEIPDMLLQVAKDRKSTRLNSSHVSISYAVFCLKKQ